MMRNVESDTSVTALSAVLVTRTFTVLLIASATVQAYVPVVASVELVMTTVCNSSENAFFEYSSFTVDTEPLRVQVIGCAELTIQTSAPLGDVKVTTPLIVKLASEVSETVSSEASDTRRRTSPPMKSPTVHPYGLPAGVDATMEVGYVVPPSTESSSLTLEIEPVRVHVTLRDSPTSHVSAPLGDVRTTLP
jgi:hypothetical protein